MSRALLWLILGEWRAQPIRVATAALAIAVGVALGFAVHLINASALSEFSRAIDTVNGDADLQVQSVSPAGFDEALYPKLARAPGVAIASPVVQLTGALPGEQRGLTVLGLDIFRAAHVTPNLLGRPSGNTVGGAGQVFDENSVFLSPALMQGRKPGDIFTLSAGGRTVPLTIAGPLPAVDAERRIAVLDIAAAQWRFDQIGRLQRIDLKLSPGADRAATGAAIARMLPPQAELVTRESQTRRSDSLSRAYRVNLNMLALMALLTGGFLVFSAQSLSVARRRAQFALLRVLGTNRRALLSQVLIEGGIVGAVGSVLGLGLGLALAYAALNLLGGDLGSGYFQGSRPTLVFAPIAAGVFFLLGLACALVGSLLPAREAANAQPAVALKNVGDALDPSTRPGIRLALLLLGLGAACAFGPPVAGLPLLGYVSMALLLAGGVAAMPWLARLLLSPLQARPLKSPTAELAVRRLWGAPSQAAVALCGIVASTSLMIAMAVMVSSFRGSVDDWLYQVLPDDLYIRFAGPSEVGGLDPAGQARISALPGVAEVAFTRATPLRLSTDAPPVALVAQPVTRADPGARLPMIGTPRAAPPGLTPVWVSEPAAWLNKLKVGQTITLPLDGAPKVYVAGLWRDYARQNGAVVLTSEDYSRLTGDALRGEASIRLKPGAEADKVGAAVLAALPPDVAARTEMLRPAQIRDIALGLFDRSFAITYVLELVAILVGLAGVAATVSAQTLARTKEFGMLRHLGVRKRQITAMLAIEGALLGAVGVAAGLTLGLIMSQVLIHVVNPQSFHWTMQTRLPWGLFLVVTAGLIAASAGTALLAGRRALSVDAVRAVREDW
ncbi:FtsX-like permease family protein [Caulobacter sp. SLTY]|uniref:FtsX-like permease family protein n=1 Tax=Caulobacter sp. SLTY TaxID=2683262 RepID=UPI001413488C|nr:FtsX-like permease family protein [Caulobacter sp. SLTY]NBB16789.1 FtsX-like permease family protein [Caulobacter sp. SLTY]